MHLSPTDVHSKAVVLLLLINCLPLLHLFVGFYGWSLFCYSVRRVLLVSNQLDREKIAGCFTLTVFLMSCDSQCSVSFSRRCVLVCSVNCGIS